MGAYSPLRPVERRLLYYPEPYSPKAPWTTPTAHTEDVWFKAADGTQLHGWYLSHPEPRGVALLCHGNGGNVATYAESIRRLNEEHRLTVMSFDYRGYGRSGGLPDEVGIMQDARAARDWLCERTGTQPDDLIIMGFSLGGGVAVDLAAKDGAKGLVLWSTFSNVPETAAYHYPWLPTNLLMTQRFDSLSKIDDYPGPLLQSHGTKDRVIPYDLAQRLFSEHRGPKRFVTIPGADHLDADSAEYRQILDDFIGDLDAGTRLSVSR
jgi:fermentation-respiration switch protein FrsA (DUF1100 family)